MANPEDAALNRRRFVLGAAGTVAGAGLTKLAWPSSTSAASSRAMTGAVLPAPNPIPGGAFDARPAVRRPPRLRSG